MPAVEQKFNIFVVLCKFNIIGIADIKKQSQTGVQSGKVHRNILINLTDAEMKYFY